MIRSLPPRQAGHDRGFTLIELLVVIAIIAILAAILFPVFAQARAKARQTSCLSNTKQVALGVLMYVQDYDETFPSPWYNYDWLYNGEFERDRVWGQVIQPYIKNWQIYRCPSDPNANDSTLTAGATDPLQKEYNWALRMDYGWNYVYLSPFLEDATAPGISLAGVGSPAGTIMTVDSIWDKSGASPRGGGNWFVQAPCLDGSPTWYWFGPWEFDNNESWFQFGGMYPWHSSNTSVNTTFVDGHVKSLNIQRTLDGCDVRAIMVTDPGYPSSTEQYLWDTI